MMCPTLGPVFGQPIVFCFAFPTVNIGRRRPENNTKHHELALRMYCCVFVLCPLRTNTAVWSFSASNHQVRFASEDLNPVQLDFIEKGRNSLKCLLCGHKGTCVQCAGGRCLHSYHPWCLIHSARGIIHRSISVQSHLNVSYVEGRMYVLFFFGFGSLQGEREGGREGSFSG